MVARRRLGGRQEAARRRHAWLYPTTTAAGVQGKGRTVHGDDAESTDGREGRKEGRGVHLANAKVVVEQSIDDSQSIGSWSFDGCLRAVVVEDC